MEWYWCGADGACWASWFWSPGTAAWAQAILTGIAILASGWLGRMAFSNSVELERQKVHMAQIETVGRFDVLLGSAAVHLRKFLEESRDNDGKIPQPYFRVVARDLEKQEAAIRIVMMESVPGVHIFRDMVAVANDIRSVEELLNEIADGVAHPRLDLAIEVLKDIDAYAPKLLDYRKALNRNRDATWAEVHPEHTGYAHQLQAQAHPEEGQGPMSKRS